MFSTDQVLSDYAYVARLQFLPSITKNFYDYIQRRLTYSHVMAPAWNRRSLAGSLLLSPLSPAMTRCRYSKNQVFTRSVP